MTRTAVPSPRSPISSRGPDSSRPGRLLVLTLGSGSASLQLAGAAKVVHPLQTSGWSVEWATIDTGPERLGTRSVQLHRDVAAQTQAAFELEQARAARAAAGNRPQRLLRRIEERLKQTKHAAPTAGGGITHALKKLLARGAFRVVRPLRKLDDRLAGAKLAELPVAAVTTPAPSAPSTDTTLLPELLAALGPRDMVLLTAAEPRHLEWLLELVPAMGIDRPIDTTLHILFANHDAAAPARGEVDLATLATRWRSGSPFRSVFCHAENADLATARSRQTGLVVRAETPIRPAADAAVPPSLTVDRLGPVALQITALWGRTGSTSIFDSQASYLVQRGFLVIRILVEHWPHRGEERTRRIQGLVAENMETVRPHAWLVVERNESAAHTDRLQADPEFRRATSLKRMAMLFAEPTTDDRQGLAWAARRAQLAVVNHLPHALFAAQLTRAPMVLETHDIYTHLLATHGVPQFVPANPVTKDAQLAEEGEVFARFNACVNLSPEDQAVVSRHARNSHVVRPYARSRTLTRRSWPEVVAANKLDAGFLANGSFDLMLWGDWHGGNIAGVKWFVESVLPRFPRLAAARIVLVGRVARGLPEGWAAQAGLLVAGFVDRLDDFILRSKVMLIPDQGGSGISIKAMDVFAFGRPFVSTSVGMRSVATGDTGYRPTDDPEAFGNDIVRLLQSHDAREARAEIARRLYDLNFSQQTYASSWDAVLAGAAPEALAAAGRTLPPAVVGETSAPVAPATTTKPSSNGDRMRISIIICTYDRYDVLPDAIASAQAQVLDDGDFEIIVVDNSPDQQKAAEWARNYADEPHVRYHLEPIPGLSNARNVGTELARAGIVAFMDDDAIASPRWAAELLAAFAAYPNAGVVGGLVHPKWIGDQGASWLHEDNIGYLSIVNWGSERRPLQGNEWVAGCNISFRRDVLLGVGGFSRSLGRIGSGASLLSNEETAVSEKIHATGKISVYAPAAWLHHVIDPKRLTREWFRKRAAWQAVSDFIKDPKRCSQYSPQAVQHLRYALEPGRRTAPLGTFHATDDKEVFKGDMGVMYDLVIALLSGGFEHEQRRP